MIQRFKQAARSLLGRVNAARSVTVFPDDVFIVSYPRSGNTWVRFLLANLISEQTVTFANIERIVPDIYKHTDEALRKTPRPRILKSHEYFDPRYPKVVYLVRDPRDVVVSYYHYCRKVRAIEDDFSMEEFVTRFVAGKLNPFGSWAEHVISWFALRGDNKSAFRVVRYEDILAAPVDELARIATFFGREPSHESLTEIANRSSADRMRALEMREANLWVMRDSRREIPFVRKATAGHWKEELQAPCVDLIERHWSTEMKRLGYI